VAVQNEPGDLMTLDEVALLLDTSASFVAQLVARDAIPFERPRKKGLGRFKADELRFRRDAIEEWLKSS
jgi:excisionase family DNA binding protein